MRLGQISAMYVIIFLATLVTCLVIILSTAVHLITILIEESDDGNGQNYGIDGQDFSTTPVVSPNDNLVNHQDEQTQQCDCNTSTSKPRPAEPEAKPEQQQQQPQQQPQQQVDGAIEVPSMSLMSPMLLAGADTTMPVESVMRPQDIIRAPPEEVQSAEMNSRLLKQCEGQREDAAVQQASVGLGAQANSQDSTQSLGSRAAAAAANNEEPTPDDPALDADWAHKPPDVQKDLISSQLGQPASKQIFEDFDPREVLLGGTALHWCKTRKSLDKLLKLGLPTDIVNKRRETAVHVAVRRHKLQVLIGLLINDAPVDSRNEHGETPLIVACKLNDLFAAQLLMVFDADYNALDARGHSPRHYTSAICARHMSQQQLPSAAHLILAMLNEIGAKRCPFRSTASETGVTDQESANEARSVSEGGAAKSARGQSPSALSPPAPPAGARAMCKTVPCTDGCSHAGTYNGNSYNRWPNYKRESLYKRHMFSDLIESKLREKEQNGTDRSWWDYRRTAPSEPKASHGAKSRLLCIDGGGMRGVIVCQIMIEMEKYLKRPMFSYFDWVGGTSVGAFLACALSHGATIKEMRRVCFDVKDEVFCGGRPYNSKFLERVLKRQYGSSTRMSEVRGVKLAVTTVLADREPCQLRLFRNYESPGRLLEMHGYAQETFNTMSGHSIMSSGHHSESSSGLPTGEPVLDENDPDPFMWQAVRASAAAPFFFKPYGPYLDGGIISNNPTLDMLSEFESYQKVRKFVCESNSPPSRLDLVVSLGTGRGRVISRQTMIDFGQVASGFATVFSPVELMRSIRAARDLFKKLMQQSCHTEDHILDRAQAWCSSMGVPYFRINPPLATIFSIDDKRDEQLINALWQTKLYMLSMRRQLEQLGKLLD